MKLSLGFSPIKKQRNAVRSHALGIIYSLNPLLQLSAFLSRWMCIVSSSEYMPCVTLYTSLCFKTLLSLLPEAVGWNCGLLKNYMNITEAKCQEMLTGRSSFPLPLSLWHIPRVSHLLSFPSQPFSCACLWNKPTLDPSSSPCISLFSLW